MPATPTSAHSPLVVLGEALIDVLPTGPATFEGVPGGAPANVAVAAARLGMPTSFVGGLSTDRWGRMLEEHLTSSDVDVASAPRSDRPTALAIVDLQDDGSATYRFLWDGTADRVVTLDELPDTSAATWLQVGSVAGGFEDSGEVANRYLGREQVHTLVSCDPNVREVVHGSSRTARTRLLTLTDGADVVKLSDEDIAWLLPDMDVTAAIDRWLHRRPGVVAITRGAQGAVIACRAGRVELDPVAFEVADTVAAGDTFMAALLVGLSDADVADRDALADLDLETIEAVGRFAAGAAAVTVSRVGADPPRRADLDPALLLG